MGLHSDGFEIVPAVLAEADRAAILALLPEMSQSDAGTRDLLNAEWCREVAIGLRRNPVLSGLVPPELGAVQCTYFAKTESSNWLVAYHQDLSIPVRERVPAPSCSAWSVKQGITFVQPPLSLLERLIAVRVHLDESNHDNGPLRVIPRSHGAGRIPSGRVAQFKALAGEASCLVPELGALVFKPLLLHASSKSQSPLPRRVLHFLFGPHDLPDGLAWCAIV